jgi:hypothetical protein
VIPGESNVHYGREQGLFRLKYQAAMSRPAASFLKQLIRGQYTHMWVYPLVRPC